MMIKLLGNFKKGSILILSIWTLSFLSLLAFFSGGYLKQQILAIKKIEQRKKAYSLAKSGVLLVIESFDSKESIDQTKDWDFVGDSWVNNPDLFKNIKFEDGHVDILSKRLKDYNKKYVTRYGLIDEERKININYASLEILENLLSDIGRIRRKKAFVLANRIIDWRDSDDLKNISDSGLSERVDYLKKGYAYTPKNSFFIICEELMLVDGIGPELFSKIKNYFTVYTDGKINVNTASKEVLLSLNLKSSLVDKIISYRVGPDLVSGNSDDKSFKLTNKIVKDLEKYLDLTDLEKSQLQEAVDNNFLTCRSDYFAGESVSRIDNTDVYGKINFVFDRGGKIYYWSSNL
jgi:type II secretory pathway component PulK